MQRSKTLTLQGLLEGALGGNVLHDGNLQNTFSLCAQRRAEGLACFRATHCGSHVRAAVDKMLDQCRGDEAIGSCHQVQALFRHPIERFV